MSRVTPEETIEKAESWPPTYLSHFVSSREPEAAPLAIELAQLQVHRFNVLLEGVLLAAVACFTPITQERQGQHSLKRDKRSIRTLLCTHIEHSDVHTAKDYTHEV